MTQALVITGASRGIGAHIAEQALAAGYHVHGLSRHGDNNKPYPVHACDVANDADLKKVFSDLKKGPPLYGLIHAAGIASMNLTLTSSVDQIRAIVETNLLGTIFINRHMGKILARRKQGRIINFSTIAVPLALKGEAAYVASKAGVEGFSRAFAQEMADFNVTVNTIAPGPIATDLIRGVPEQAIQHIIDRQIQPYPATVTDIWDQVSLLLDQRAGRITGEVIHVGGC